MERLLDELFQDRTDVPHGVIVAAACEFSKKTRDVFRSRCLSEGVEESLLWGKGELEDLLFRPANDHLLWAYFGISIRVRRRSWRSLLASRLTTKRKLTRHLGEIGQIPSANEVMIRSTEAEHYPWPEDIDRFLKAPQWRYYKLRGLIAPDLVVCETATYFACWDTDEGTWDYIETADTSWPSRPELVGIEREDVWQSAEPARRYWTLRIPEEQRAMCVELSIIHYDQIMLVDELGDAYHPPPHLIVDYEERSTPFRRSRLFLEMGHGYTKKQEPVDGLTREDIFSKPIPEIPEEEWKAHLEAERAKFDQKYNN
jgi:hypothetical protein